MGWIEFSGFVAVAAAILFLPGLLVARAARLPWVTSLGIAPAVSSASIAGAAIVANKIGVRWGLVPALGITVVLAAAGLLLSSVGRFLSRRTTTHERPPSAQVEPAGRTASQAGEHALPRWAWWVATAIGASALMCYHIKVLIGHPASFSQTFDNIFHLSAIRWILDHGNGSSLGLTMTSGNNPPAFYPLAWHDTVSLVLLTLRSTNVPAANNAVIMAVAAFVWVAGCLLLARTALKCSIPGIIAAGFLTSAFPTFPYGPLSFGVLYPNFYGISLLPSVVALTLTVFGYGRGPRISMWSTIPIGLIALLGMALAHPNTIALYCVFVAPLLVGWTVRSVRRGKANQQWAVWGGATALCVVGFFAIFFLWKVIRPDENAAIWTPTRTVPQALGEAIAMAPGFSMVAWVPAAAVITGAVVVIRTRHNLWMLVSHLLMIWLWVVVAAWPWGDSRTAIVGIWYNDANRLAAALPLTAFPLAVTGCSWFGQWVTDRLGTATVHGRRLPARLLESVVAGATVLVLLLTTQTTGYLRTAIGNGAKTYRVEISGDLVDSDELALIQRLPKLLPPGAVVATAPYNGSSMAFALENISTTTTHVLYSPTADITVINMSLDDAQELPSVCRALEDLNVQFVLDFGPKEINNDDWAVNYQGFDDLSTSPGFTEIAREGHAVLYRIDACHS